MNLNFPSEYSFFAEKDMIQYETTHNHRSIDTADHRSGGTGCSTAFVGMGNRWTFEEGASTWR